MLRKVFPFFLILLLVSGYLTFNKYQKQQDSIRTQKGVAAENQTPDYLIILVGDSMTEYLGNATEMRGYLAEDYPGKTFDIYNYGFGGTNILTVPDRLNNWTKHGRDFKPILDYEPQIIIIESMGNNPLSQYPLVEGLKRQNEILEQIVGTIRSKRPNTKIVFLATIAPNSQKYAEGIVDLSSEERKQWVTERVAYIQNHIDYAKSHNISLINVFDKSKDSSGDGNLQYIENHSYIHPSPKGIEFIQKEIADFIYNNKLLN